MRRTVMLLATFMTMSVSVLWADPGIFPQVSMVYQQDRSDKEDTICFRNKDVLRGQVVNESISMATQYGLISVPRSKCAGISFEGARSNTESVVTVNFNRFTGIITDNTIRFKIGSSGTVIPIRKEKIRYILLRKTPQETDFVKDHAQADLFVMANGDLITGESVEREITMVTDYAKIPVGFSEIKTVQMQGGDNVIAIVTKTNGDTMRGFLTADEISIDLELGITIESIYKDKFAKVFVDKAHQQAPAQFALASPVSGESDGSAFPDVTVSRGQTLELNLEPLLGQRAIKMEFVLIPAGSFVMGSSAGEEGHLNSEGPLRKVTLPQPFYMGIYEVTQEEYNAVVGNNPSRTRGLKNPVEKVSWNDAIAFCKKMSEITKMKVTLPTEAQWEYACRAGSQTRFCFGDKDSDLDAYAWHSKNSGGMVHPVGQKKPNKFGLHDMHGNVCEWCLDWYQDDYRNLPSEDPVAPSEGSGCVYRGGGCKSNASFCRSANRSACSPEGSNAYLGFRVLAVPAGQ